MTKFGRPVVFLLAVLVASTAFAQDDPVPEQARIMIEQANAQLEAAGSNVRIVEAWFFTVGQGTEPYRRLRTGSKWIPRTVGYIIDGSDLTTDVPAADAEAALVSSFDSWNEIANTDITAVRQPDSGGNFDVLDGTFHPVTGACLTIFDVTSPNLNLGAGQIYPESDIVVGGWLSNNYFQKCLGSSRILGVTFTFASGDANSDQYTDRLYVEQFYNERFAWVTSGSPFLGPLMDIETVAVHENGHAHGLGHFGGPNTNEPFKLQPNGKVFDPEAVMNPFYLGGEKRTPLPTDRAGLRTLYANPR